MKNLTAPALLLAGALALAGVACRGSSPSGSPDGGTEGLDPRCQALCEDDEPECARAASTCLAVCQARIEGTDGLCASCLLEDAHQSGACDDGALCCPTDPTFPVTVVECGEACAGSRGTVPSGDHPVCTALCADDEPECAEASASCLASCGARVEGVTGLCATCLLEGAHQSGACADGSVCCPGSPTYPTGVADCTSLCGD